VVTRRLQAERRTGSVRRPKTGVPPTVLLFSTHLYSSHHIIRPTCAHILAHL